MCSNLNGPQLKIHKINYGTPQQGTILRPLNHTEECLVKREKINDILLNKKKK